jgi:HAE1 family hydrophobic/amphiphilic exporter-1
MEERLVWVIISVINQFFSLIVVPVIYEIMEKLIQKLKGKQTDYESMIEDYEYKVNEGIVPEPKL